MSLVEFLIYIKQKIHTVILREGYHDTMQILLYYGNIMNMFQRKSLKLQC